MHNSSERCRKKYRRCWERRPGNSAATGNWLLLFRHAPEAELNEVFGFEFPAGPAISLLELNPELVTRPVELAVFDTGLAFVSGEFQRHNGSRRDGLFAFEAGA